MPNRPVPQYAMPPRILTPFISSVGRGGCLMASFMLMVSSVVFGIEVPDVFANSAPLREAARQGVRNERLEPRWLEDGARLWFRTVTAEGTGEFYRVDAATGERRPLFDHARLREALTRAGVDAEVVRLLRLDAVEADVSAQEVVFSLAGKSWVWTEAGRLEESAAPAAAASLIPRASPPGTAEVMQIVRNETADRVHMWWLDLEGRRRSYGHLEAGQSTTQRTFAGHVWLVTDVDGAELTAFVADPDRPEVAITGKHDIRWATPPRDRRRGRRAGPSGQANPSDRSPNGQLSIFIRNHNVYLRSGDDTSETAVTSDGTAEDSYEGPFFWSPDGTRVAVHRHRAVDPRRVTAVRSSPDDQVHPRVESWEYAKPGDPLPFRRLRLIDVTARTALPADESLFPTPFAIGSYHWAPDSSAFHFLYNERGHQLLRLVALGRDGTAHPLLDERSPTFVDYSQKSFLHWLDDSDEFIWMSERSGWNHLYLCDARTGSVKNAITSGHWVVRSVEHIDAEAREITVRGYGLHPGQDPYHAHFARVRFDGTGMVLLTHGDGTHTIEEAPDRRTFVATWSRTDHPPVHEWRRRADGSLICELNRADASALVAQGWPAPERFAAAGRDGETPIHGLILRPWNFDPAQSYPIIESIYAGPHDFHVPKDFRAWHRHWELANLGFVVVLIDGMGTNWRHRAFHEVAWQNLGDAGFPDRIAWITAAAATRPWMDLTRVGIFGGSAGGQNAMRALIAHGDFYSVAAADCGCHDNRMDKVWWNEAWMGFPVGDHYVESSNVAQAHRLRGHLLLTVGELDRNVDPASTMQVVNALIKADKDFDLLILPNADHGAGESPYAARRRARFFLRHLKGS